MKRKQRARIRRLQDKQREEQELQEGMRRLQSMVGGFSRSPYKGELPKSKHPRHEDIGAFLKQSPNAHLLRKREAKILSAEMQAREEAAKQQAVLLKARVGVVGNKMGLQYLTESDLEDSRKGLMRRR